MSLYCAASFARGAGLGTCLFPWARCKVYSQLTGARMLAPSWTRLRLGPLLRGGTSLRAYHSQILLLNQFVARSAYLRGMRKAWVLARAQRIDEDQAPTTMPPLSATPPLLVTFRGYGRLFEDLYPHRPLLLSELREEAQPRSIARAYQNRAAIAINVRCGNDFQAAATPEDYFRRGAIKTPLEWFMRILDQVRACLGRDEPAVVVSDGTASQLAPLLVKPNVHFARPGAALSDLFTLAQSKVLLAAGGSSFSAWGAFLADSVTLSHPGQSMSWFGVHNTRGLCVGTADADEGLGSEVAEQIRRAIG